MRGLFITLKILCGPFFVVAQPALVDSLSQAYTNAASEVVRADILLVLAEAYLEDQPDTTLHLLAQTKALSALPQNEQWRITFLTAQAHIWLGQQRKAFHYLKQLTEASEENSIPLSGKKDIYYELGRTYRRLGINDSALVPHQESLKLSQQLSDTTMLDLNLYSIANIYLDLGLYKMSLENFQQCLDYSRRLKDPKRTCAILNDMARIYDFTEDFGKAEEYFQKAYQLAQKHQFVDVQQVILNNLGYILKKNEQYAAAKTYFNQALGYSRYDVCRTSYPLYNLGNIYRETGQLDSAHLYLDRALWLADSCTDLYIQTLLTIEKGRLAMEERKLSQSLKRFQEALSMARTAYLIKEESEALKELSVVYEEYGDYENAYMAFKQHKHLKDSLYNEQNVRELERLENTYAFEKQQEAERTARQWSDIRKEQVLNEALETRNYFIIGFLAMALVAFFIYQNFRRKQQANQTLRQLNARIQSQAEELRKQSEDLRKVNLDMLTLNESLEQHVAERTKIITEQSKRIIGYMTYNSHQVRGPLARILGMIHLFSQEAISEDELAEALEKIGAAAEELDTMVKEMNEELEHGRLLTEEGDEGGS